MALQIGANRPSTIIGVCMGGNSANGARRIFHDHYKECSLAGFLPNLGNVFCRKNSRKNQEIQLMLEIISEV